MTDAIDPAELRAAVRPVLTDLRGDTWPIPDEEGRGMDSALWQQCAQLGWLQLPIPEAQGGLGLGLSHLAVVYEELGRALASVPYLSTMLALQAIARGGNPPACEHYLDAIGAGTCRAAIAVRPFHPALRPGKDGRVTGEVPGVLFADVADLVLLPFEDSEGAGLIAVPAAVDGMQIRKRALIDLTRSLADVRLEAVDLWQCHILRLGMEDMSRLLDHAAIGLACDSVGGASAIFETTLDHLKTREQFGRQIGSFQALKHRAADWKCRLEMATALSRHAAALAAGETADSPAMASGAMALSCDMFAGLSGDAIQLHGGIGFTWEHPCHLFLKRAKLNQHVFGSSTYHRDRQARLAFGHDRAIVPPRIPAISEEA